MAERFDGGAPAGVEKASSDCWMGKYLLLSCPTQKNHTLAVSTCGEAMRQYFPSNSSQLLTRTKLHPSTILPKRCPLDTPDASGTCVLRIIVSVSVSGFG